MSNRFKGVFTTNDFTSEERYDFSKIIRYTENGYDALNSPLLFGLKSLPVWRYYRVDEGYKDIDLISYDAYGTLFYSYLIQIYNDTIEETFPEGTVLNLFSIEDLEVLYGKVMNGKLDEI